MADLSPEATKALAYWSQIEYAARNGLNTADLWGAIRDAADELGLATPGVTVQGVSQLRGMAVGIQRRESDFERLADGRVVTGRMFGVAPWSRSNQEQRALPKFQVRFQHTFLQEGEEVTEWRSSIFEGKLPRTAGEIRSLVDGDGVQLADKYNVEHISTDGLQLLAI